MSVRPSDTWPVGLARTWAGRYNRFLVLAVALREFARKGWPTGHLRGPVTDAAWDVLDAEDHLQAHGYAPGLCVGGDEAVLRARAFEYALAVAAGADTPAELEDQALRNRAAWDRFAAFVAALPDECFTGSPTLEPGALRPERLAAVLGRGRRGPAPAEHAAEPGGEHPGLCPAEPHFAR